jgi:hypothetical protein
MPASSTPENDATVLTLDELVHGFPNIPAEGGAMMAQAAAVCLDHRAHKPHVRLPVHGDFSATFSLSWSEGMTEAKRRFWNDLEEATQQGAYAVAILLIRALTGFTIIERSRKGTGFDWWLGTEDNLFQGKARLEVSGILRGAARRINSRIKARMRQIRQSDHLALSAYVVVVEFGSPRAKVVQR